MIVIINGAPRVGKDTVCQIAEEILGKKFCHSLSSIDEIKRIALIGGWNGEKNPRSRKFLSDLKDLFSKFNDMPFNTIINKVKEIMDEYDYYDIKENSYIIFIHVREPEEILRLVTKLNAITLLIKRENNEIISNHADSLVNDYTYDYTILNTGTLDELKKQVHQFLNYYGINK